MINTGLVHHFGGLGYKKGPQKRVFRGILGLERSWDIGRASPRMFIPRLALIWERFLWGVLFGTPKKKIAI